MGFVKRTGLIAWLVGIAVLIALTVWSGAGLVGQALASVGAGVLLIVLVRIATVSTAVDPVYRPLETIHARRRARTADVSRHFNSALMPTYLCANASIRALETTQSRP